MSVVLSSTTLHSFIQNKQEVLNAIPLVVKQPKQNIFTQSKAENASSHSGSQSGLNIYLILFAR